MRRLSRAAGLLVAVALLGTPSVADARDHVPRPLGASSVGRVKIVDNRFRPGSITVARGSVVKWTNRGDNTHTTTSTTGLWNSGNLLPSDSFRRRFRRAGTFNYVCMIHPNMHGTITVT